MAEPDMETASAPPQPPPLRSAVPVIDYPTQSAGNPDGTRALLFGLLGFVPFVTGILAIRHGFRGLQRVAAEPRMGGVGKSRAGVALGAISLAAWLVIAMSLPPAVVKSRRAARHVACASQLRQIGAAVMMYSTRNRGFVPATLDDLVNAKLIPATMLTCPAVAGDPSKPAASTGAYGSYSYVYLGSGRRIAMMRAAASTPLAYEPPTNHADGMLNVLYFDGHVEILNGAAAQSVIAQANAAVPSAATGPSTQPATVPAQNSLP